MSDVLDAYTLLAQLIYDDPTQQLAVAAAWLDPDSFSGYGEMDSDDPLIKAYCVLRDCFPDAYAEMNLLLQQQATREELENFALNAINERIYPPLPDALEAVLWGLPTAALGVYWFESDLEQTNPELIPFVEDYFGITQRLAQTYSPDDSYNEAGRVASALVKSLYDRRTSSVYEELHHLIGWCFSCSGNTMVDYSNEEISEMGMEPLNWTLKDIEFNRELHEEAEEMVQAAGRALEMLETDTEIQSALRKNIKTLRRQMKKGTHDKYDYDSYARYCKWPNRPQDRVADETESDD